MIAVAASAQSPEVVQATQVVNQLRFQVGAGLAPRQQLQEAENALDDARDAEVANRLFEHDLTEETAVKVIEAAKRRLDRVHASVERQQKLLDAGILAKQDIKSYTEDQQWAQQQYDMAVSQIEIIHEMAEMALVEQQKWEEWQNTLASQSVPDLLQPVEYFNGKSAFGPDEFKKVQAAFEKVFTKPLPVSADGETAVHRAMHFDHTNRVDVALTPDTPEGVWLRHFLEASNIPYFAFRKAIPGQATGAHIHIGPPSRRT